MTAFNLSETNKSTNFSQDLFISAESYVAVACVLFFIGFFGFFLNLAVIVFMWKEKQLWTPLNVILFNLVISDFLVSILGNPWTFVSALNHRWVFGKIGCIFYGFIMSLLGITSIITLTVLAFERYLIIARPLNNGILNFRSAYISVGVVWIYSLFLTVPPLIGWGEYVNESANISCSINWEEKSTNSMTYILYLFIFGLIFPLLIITFSYANIIFIMKKNIYKTGQVSKAEHKVAYMILLMILAFLIAWSPYAILALVIQFGDASFITHGVAVIPALLAKSSICYNPIIYIGLNAQFQQMWRQGYKNGNKTESSRGISCVSGRNAKMVERKKGFSGRKRSQDGMSEVTSVV